MLSGLLASGKLTKLNIVIIPFKKSHCPTSPLRVCNKVFPVAVRSPTEAVTVDHGRFNVSLCFAFPDEAVLNCACSVSFWLRFANKVPVHNTMFPDDCEAAS